MGTWCSSTDGPARAGLLGPHGLAFLATAFAWSWSLWGLWQLPLFWIDGALQSRLPVWPFLASTIALSVAFGWLSQRSEGSVLPALTLHTAVNWWAWVVPGLLIAGHQRQMTLTLAMLVLAATGLLVGPLSRLQGTSTAAPSNRPARRSAKA